MAKASDAGQNLIGRLRPDERLGIGVGDGDVLADRRFEGERAPMRSAADLLLAQQSEPALDQIQPRGARRREVEVHARMSRAPAVNERRLVRAVVVDNQVDVEGGRDRGVNRVEKLSEFDRAVPSMELADDRAGLGVEGGKERGRAVADVLMRPPLDLPRDASAAAAASGPALGSDSSRPRTGPAPGLAG